MLLPHDLDMTSALVMIQPLAMLAEHVTLQTLGSEGALRASSRQLLRLLHAGRPPTDNLRPAFGATPCSAWRRLREIGARCTLVARRRPEHLQIKERPLEQAGSPE